MKYYIIAGEASGDLHGANMIKELVQLDPQAEIRAWGGDLMSAAGAEVVKHYRNLAFMGFLEVIKNIRTIQKNFKYCKADISAFKPDTVVFVDYPGFNLRMARWAKKQGYRTQYYISPTIWAWNTKRVHKVKAYIDQMFTILPFESKVYQKYGYQDKFVGHPLLDAIDQAHFDPVLTDSTKKTIALLPGSRKQELEKMLPVIKEVVEALPEYNFILAAVPWQALSFYQSFFNEFSNVNIEVNKTYNILQSADAAIVTSGTATLETALFNVPQVVVYKTSTITYTIAKNLAKVKHISFAKNLAKVKHISLPNLILDEGVLRELVQAECTAENIIEEVGKLFDADARKVMLDKYATLHTKLGDIGASKRVAEAIFDDVKTYIS